MPLSWLASSSACSSERRAVAIFLGRPVNLWVGFISGAVSTAITIIAATQPPEIAQQWGIILGAVGGFLGLFVAFLAGQPPTLQAGDTFHIQQPAGIPNTTGVVTPPEPVSVDSTPPASDGEVVP